MKSCPYCAEQLQDAAIVCRFCNRDISTPLDQPSVRPKQQRPGLWLTIAVAGFLFSVFSPVGLLLGFIVMWIAFAKAITAKSGGIRWGGAFVAALIASSTAVGINLAAIQGGGPPSSATSSPARPVTSTAPRGWEIVKTWSGSGMKETERFRTTRREWRIRWQTDNEPFAGAGILQIYVYGHDGSMVTLAANKQGTGSDVSYVRSPPGEHYLMFNSANVDYTVTVEEER